MTDKYKALAASFNAGKAHRDAKGANSVQMTVNGSIAALISAMDMGFVPVDDVKRKQFDSCAARVELKDPVTGAITAALQINRTGGLWKEGVASDQLIEKVVAGITDAHRDAAEKLAEQLGL